HSITYFLILSAPCTSYSLIVGPTAKELHNLPTRCSFTVRLPMVSGRKVLDNPCGRQIGADLLPTFPGRSNILSRIPQADSTVITCSTSHEGAFSLQPLLIKNRRVMVPWPHSSRSTQMSCTQVAAQFTPMIPCIPSRVAVSRYVVLVTSLIHPIVPSWLSTAIFSISDSSSQVTFQ